MIEKLPKKLLPGRERANWIYELLSSRVNEDELERDLRLLAKNDPETFCTLIADQLSLDYSKN